MKKVASLFLAVLMIFTVAVTAFAAPNKKQTEIINEYNIVRLEEIAGENGKSADPTIIILSEEELLEQGENVKDLFNKAEMLYVLTDMSNSAIQRVCNLPALVSSDDVQDSGIRMCATQERCYTTVTLSCPFVTILGIELNENTLSRAWYIDY